MPLKGALTRAPGTSMQNVPIDDLVGLKIAESLDDLRPSKKPRRQFREDFSNSRTCVSGSCSSSSCGSKSHTAITIDEPMSRIHKGLNSLISHANGYAPGQVGKYGNSVNIAIASCLESFFSVLCLPG